MKLPEFIYKAIDSKNTSVGNNDAFPKRSDVDYEYMVIKTRYSNICQAVVDEFGSIPTIEDCQNMLSTLIRKTQKLEEPIRHQLEELCYSVVNTALSTPPETILLKCSLVDKVSTDNVLRILPESDDNEGYSFEDVEQYEIANKLILKRRLMNALVQGVSYWCMIDTLSSSMFDEWSEELPVLYQKIITLNDYLLFAKQEKISDKNPMLGSYVETHLGTSEKKTIIKSQGMIYPLLLQETFRGFFELFASQGLSKDKSKAQFIINHADFLVAEPWDLRIGTSIWLDMENIMGDKEISTYPYLFQDLSKMGLDEFNDTLKNVFSKTKKGYEVLTRFFNKVEHDIEYKKFKQDLANFDVDNGLITDEPTEETPLEENN